MPASRSRTRWLPSRLTGAILGSHVTRPPRVRNCAGPPDAERSQLQFSRWLAERDGGDAGRTPRSGRSCWSRSGSSSPRSRSPAASPAAWAIDVYNSAPPLSSLKPVQKGRSSAIYAADGSLIGFIRSSNIRQPVPARALPQDLKDATVAIEDQRLLRPRRDRLRRRSPAPPGRTCSAGGKPVAGRLDDHPAARPQPLHPAPRRDDQAKADRSAPRLRTWRTRTRRTGSSPTT